MTVQFLNKLFFLLLLLTFQINSFGQGTSSEEVGSGSGFAISSNGYIVTNHHVVYLSDLPIPTADGKERRIPLNLYGDYFQITQTINGESTNYLAKLVSQDPANDLAILKVVDSKFKGFGTLPYIIKTETADKGSDIFTLGYPRTDVQGKELKVTKGIIISQTGEMGDKNHYSISAPIDHGSSGGPLFDSDGNLIGITDSGIDIITQTRKKPDEDALSTPQYYAIKINSLKQSMDLLPEIQKLTQNTIWSLPFTQKVKILEKNVFIVTTFINESTVRKIKNIVRETIGVGENIVQNSPNQNESAYINPNKITFNKGFMSRNFMIGNRKISSTEAENYTRSNFESDKLMQKGSKSYKVGSLMFFAGPIITLGAVLSVAGKPQDSVADAVGLIGIGGFIGSFFLLSSANRNFTNAVYKYNFSKGLVTSLPKSQFEVGYLGGDKLGLRFSF